MVRRDPRQDMSHPLGVLGERVEATSPVGLPDGVRSADVTQHEAVLWARGDGPGTLVVQLTAGAHVGRVLRGPRVDRASAFTGRIELTGLTAGRAYDAALWFEGADGTRGEIGRLCFRTASASRSTTSFAWLLPQSDATAYAAVHRLNPDVVIDLRADPGPEDPTSRPLRADVPFLTGGPDRRIERGPLLDVYCLDPDGEDRSEWLAHELARSRAVWRVVAGAGPDVEGVVCLGSEPLGSSEAAFGHASIRNDAVLSASLHDARGEAMWRTDLQPRR